MIEERSLRVLMVAPTSFFNDYGGHIRILEETLALQEQGVQVTIVTYRQGQDIDGLDIRRTARLPYHADYEVGSSRHKLAFDVYLLGQTLLEGMRARPDIIHGHMHEGALIGSALAKMLRRPLVFDFQGGLTGEMVDHGFLNPDGRIFPWVWWLERFICHLPNVVLTSSLRAKQLLQREFGVAEERVVPLPDCVDTGRFNRERVSQAAQRQLKQSLGIPDERPVVAYLGLLADYQGTDHLVQAAALLKRRGRSVHFLIMGYPRVAYYQAMARRLDVADRITFTGKVPYERAPLYLSLGDVAVSVKMSETEGSGKVLNYMALAQPVVAYDTRVHREYLAEWGTYVPVADVPGLATSIAELIDDPERRQDLGVALRHRAKNHYSWTRAGDRIQTVYKALLGGGDFSGLLSNY
ncbi:MAG: glycosyltransferase family 4 protein [Candidatus Promineifilaceae bacterium]|nr:glycosyltransferase family 4 protein [Candidatus Promineifilaceae bacterium]